MSNITENDITQSDENSDLFFDNIDNNFARYCFQKIDIFDEKLIFGVYDHYELYDKNKKYNKDKYLAIYTGTPFYYLDFIYCIVIADNNDKKLYYVVSKRVPSDIQDLKKYCPCVKCSTRKLNPLKYIWCKFCTGCLKSGEWHAHPKYIEEAKQRKANDLYPDNNGVVNLNSISQCELITCAFFGLIIIYSGFYYL